MSHPSISINGNDDFHAQANVSNWPGSGTPSDPYIISGYIFEDDPEDQDSFQISIFNTDVYFRIMNCSTESGLELVGVRNGQIISNTIYGKTYLSTSSNINISNNNFPQSTEINIRTSNNSIIISNNRFPMGGTIELGSSSNNTILNNNNIGIYTHHDSGNNTIINNTFTAGLVLSDSGNNRIIGNSFNDFLLFGGTTITLAKILQAEVINNTLNGKPLLYLTNITNEIIVVDDLDELILVNSKNITISKQTGGNQSKAEDMLYLINCKNVTIINQTGFFDNVQAAFCSKVEISSNFLIGSAFSFYSSDLVNVTSNYLSNLDFYKTNNIVIHDNIVTNVTGRRTYYPLGSWMIGWGGWSSTGYCGASLYIENAINLSIINNYVNAYSYVDAKSSNYGIWINHGSHILLSNNTITSSVNIPGFGAGVHILKGSNATLIGNTLIDNGWGLYLGGKGPIVVIFNNFIRNKHHIGSWSNNANALFAYNYWDTWTSPDVNNDSIVDDPYPILESRNSTEYIFDYYPQVNPMNSSPNHILLPPTVILPNTTEIPATKPLLISWFPATDTHSHSISYSLYYAIDDGSLDWVLIASDLSGTDYLWDFDSSLQTGMVFRIKLVATCFELLTMEVVTDKYSIIKNPDSSSSVPEATPFLTGYFMIVLVMYLIRRKRMKQN
ncbi:MAG: right-handed parallel beta-helix repeat-containing protein [Candidatus Hodarchaeales archaeon]